MATVTEDQLRRALDALESKFHGVITSTMDNFGQRVTQDIAQSATTTLASVDGAVMRAIEAAKVDLLKTVDTAVMDQFDGQRQRIDEQWKEASAAFDTERASVRDLVERMRSDLASVGEGKLIEVAAQINTFVGKLSEIEARDETRADLLGQMHRKSQEKFDSDWARHEQ